MLRGVLALLILSALTYAFFVLLERRTRSAERAGAPSQTTPSPTARPAKQRPPGPIGPDDDEDFLRELGRRPRPGRPETPGHADRPDDPDMRD